MQSIGAIAIDPSNPKMVWVGTGETWTRNCVSIGDGIYKSTDGGETWTNMGLPESERIATIVVHPTDGNTVYACVPGKLWSDSDERGVYKTTDGGKTWTLVLKGGNLSTGCSVSLDPKNPEACSSPACGTSGARAGRSAPAASAAGAPSGSGLFVARRRRQDLDDARGDDRERAARQAVGPRRGGRRAVGPAAASTRSIECARSALFGSDDGGKTWEERDRSQMMVWRPFYFAQPHRRPEERGPRLQARRRAHRVDDGGRSFSGASGGAHGDWHDLWIDPDEHAAPHRRRRRRASGSRYDGGNRWWKADNLPISQFYHVSVDDKDPYQVYGGLQDNSSWVGDSAYPGGITNSRWENLYGGDGFWMFADPTDPDFVYAETQGGYIGRVNRQDARGTRHPAEGRQGREAALQLEHADPSVSPNEKGTIYIGAQFLFRSRDHGQTLGAHLARPHDQRSREAEAGAVGRRHGRQLLRRDAHDDLLDQRVAEERAP